MIFKLFAVHPIPLDDPLETWREQFILRLPQLSRISEKFLEAMTNGLAGSPSTLKMLPSFVSQPVRREGDTYLGLDLGGTNCRLIAVRLNKDGAYGVTRQESFRLTPADITGRGEDLFATRPGRQRSLVVKRPECGPQSGQ